MSGKNVKNLKMILEVAKWEFNRWFKIKEQLITLLFSAFISLLIFGTQNILENFSSNRVDIAVMNNSLITLKAKKESRINFIEIEQQDLDFQKKLLLEKEIEGILKIIDVNDAEIILNRDAEWFPEVEEILNEAVQNYKIESAGISSKVLNYIFDYNEIKKTYTGNGKNQTNIEEQIAAGIFIGMMLIGVILGLAYQFTAITGEKQMRITEVIVSAISPQTWIDGKILGISFLSLALLIILCMCSAIFTIISYQFGSGWIIPIDLSNTDLILFLVLLSLSGFFLWNTFFSAIAATINDPNTSARGSLLLIPILSIGLAFFTLGDPDSIIMKIFSLFPLTSAPVLSARLVLTDVPFYEVILAILFTFLTIWIFRKTAGKVFELSLFIYGKEPSWKEIFKWIKK